MCETKKCKVCLQDKDAKNDYQFHSSSGYYSKTCKDCSNLERRKSFDSKQSRKNEDGYSIRQKVCIKCGEAKDRNSENFKKVGKSFSNMCRSCNNEIIKNRIRNRSKGNLPEDTLKICNKCLEEKTITNFYYDSTKNKYSYSCTDCFKKAYYNPNKKSIYVPGRSQVSNIMRSYRIFDENKGWDYTLTKEYIKKSLEEPCTYCGYPSTGLDRKDNSLGHTEDNCVPACEECNKARNVFFSVEEMKIIGQAIKQVKDLRNGKL